MDTTTKTPKACIGDMFPSVFPGCQLRNCLLYTSRALCIKYGWSDRRANPALYDADGAFCG